MHINLQNHDDQSLLLELRNGSCKAFDALYDKYWEQIYSAAYKRLKHNEQAKDITQEIFMKLWEGRLHLKIENLPAYLHTAVKNNVLKWLEKEQKYTPVTELMFEFEPAQQQADSEMLFKEFFHAYNKMVNTLTGAQQTIFRMRYDQDQTTGEIAETLGISRKTVQNQLGKSVARLRESLMMVLVLVIWVFL